MLNKKMKAIHSIQSVAFRNIIVKKYFHKNFIYCTKRNMLLNFQNIRDVNIRKFN